MDNNSSVCQDQAALAAQEPAFIQQRGWLTAPPMEPGQLPLEHLSHRLTRNPADLLSHVQRIMLCARRGLPDELYGALLDLFIALGDKGPALRSRLLEKFRKRLSTQHADALLAALHSGINATDAMPVTAHSRLSAGVSGNLNLVAMIDTAQLPTATSVVDEARDLLDSGQIKTACALLEPALLAEPKNEAISHELLAVYRHTRDLTGLNAILAKLSVESLAAREEWETLANRLSTGDEHG